MSSAPPPAGAAVVDGNEAAARVAHLLSEVMAIYPITPASLMGEAVDEWAVRGHTNVWGTVPEVVEMQSEAGAAATLHGAVTRGALGTTFTASQGLLLMLPDMFKIAGELTPAVIHVAARAVATHALSIFGDHSDVMAARTTGWAMLCASSVQEVADFAAVAHAASLRSRIPFLHFFDGFRTSHELNVVDLLSAEDLKAMIDEAALADHRLRGLDPDRPVLRGSAQNPDVFFQGREAANLFHDAVPAIVAATFDDLAARSGRRYQLVEYQGDPEAERVVVLMGSGVAAVQEAVDELRARGERVGLVVVRLYRPFPTDELLAVLPATATQIAVLDRTKEPGAPGEPLFQDVVITLAEAGRPALVIGGRYGLASKEFTPAMAKAVLDELARPAPRRRFTVGIIDDVTHLSLDVDADFSTDRARVRAVFYGLGSDGTVGANKNSAKIIGERDDLFAQAYFVYDSKKSGSVTVSHLRVDPEPIGSTYLIERASFIGVHQWSLLERLDVLAPAEAGALVLLNSPHSPELLWDRLPLEVQEVVLAKGLRLFTVDANRVASEHGLAGRINTVMQAAFFALSGLLPVDDAMAALREAVRTTYAKRGLVVVERNLAVLDASVAELHEVPIPAALTATSRRRLPVPPEAPDFVQRITARMLEGKGDLLPVSAMPPGGAFPTATAKYERRTIANELPIWDSSICIDCGKCAIVCPHAAIRMKVYEPAVLEGVSDLPTKSFRSNDLPGLQLTVQVAPDDCTGCGVCVNQCPAHDKSEVKHKAINMRPIAEHLEQERHRWAAFVDLPSADLSAAPPDNVKTSQLRTPLFEFSGACSGCGETPYLKLLTQLFGDRLIVANATGCSSIYGGNLPTTPWATDLAGRGPAWSNSLFEDNAEFGLGIRLAYERQRATALDLLRRFAGTVGDDLVERIVAGVDDGDEAGIAAQRDRTEQLRARMGPVADGTSASDEGTAEDARHLLDLSSALVRRSVWIVGGDGWAYDIGAGGLDHVLGLGRNVNVLVLDTEVYSNTGGQASKATPRAAVAKFAAAGKRTAKKDLGLEAMTYGDVYVAHVALGANEIQTVKAFREAEAWPGPSIIIAYSTCIAHGIDMAGSMLQMKSAVQSGHWPLYRYKPGGDEHQHPFQLDAKAPSIPFVEFARSEGRFGVLERGDPERAATLFALAQADVDERWRYYEQLAGVERTAPPVADQDALIAEEDE